MYFLHLYYQTNRNILLLFQVSCVFQWFIIFLKVAFQMMVSIQLNAFPTDSRLDVHFYVQISYKVNLMDKTVT